MSRERDFTFEMREDGPMLTIMGYSLDELIEINKAAREYPVDEEFSRFDEMRPSPEYVDARVMWDEAYWHVTPFACNLEDGWDDKQSPDEDGAWAYLMEMEQRRISWAEEMKRHNLEHQ